MGNLQEIQTRPIKRAQVYEDIEAVLCALAAISTMIAFSGGCAASPKPLAASL